MDEKSKQGTKRFTSRFCGSATGPIALKFAYLRSHRRRIQAQINVDKTAEFRFKRIQISDFL